MSDLHANEIFREVVGLPLEGLRQKALQGKDLAKLEGDIIEEASTIADSIRATARDVAPAEDRPEIVTVLPIPNLERSRKGCIVLENNELLHSSARLISDEQIDAADIFKSLGYVMTDPGWREIVFLAARCVLHRRTVKPKPIVLRPYEGAGAPSYTVRCVGRIALDIASVVRRAGLRVEAVNSVMHAAESAGYFDQMPWLARPVIIDEKISRIADCLSAFDGQGTWRVTEQSCAVFVGQFPPGLRNEVKDLLDRITLLDRATLSSDLHAAIKDFGTPTSGQGYIAALSPDSGNLVRMLIEQEIGHEVGAIGWKIEKSILDVLDKSSDGHDLILCDDNSISGSQAECQFRAWFGVPRNEWPEDQRTELGVVDAPLRESQRESLASMNLAVAVSAGTSDAERRLQKTLKDLGVRNFRGLLRARDVTPSGFSLSSGLEAFMKTVGADLLASCRHKKDDGVRSLKSDDRAKCERDALGYNGARGPEPVNDFETPTVSIY